MSLTVLAAGDQLIKLWPRADLTLLSRESQKEDVGTYTSLILFFCDPPRKLFLLFGYHYFMIIRTLCWFSRDHIMKYERKVPTGARTKRHGRSLKAVVRRTLTPWLNTCIRSHLCNIEKEKRKKKQTQDYYSCGKLLTRTEWKKKWG